MIVLYHMKCHSLMKFFSSPTTQLYKFEKKDVPDDVAKKEEMATILSQYGISLKQYKSSLKTPVKRQSCDIATSI